MWPAGLLCRMLGVSRTAYYHWLRHGPRKQDSMLETMVKTLFESSLRTYGTRRIKKDLRDDHGWLVSRRRIRGVMQALGLRAKARARFRVATTDSNHRYACAPNRLGQNFRVAAPGKVYAGDITYIRTGEGWLYLATVIDLYSRSVVGWATDSKLHTPLVLSAMERAKERRGSLSGAIFHSDRGSQYASDAFKDRLGRYGMIQSMSGKGNCYDNAVAESFFKTIKSEMIYHERFASRWDAVRAISAYINFYNQRRRHSYNDYQSPMKKELRWWQEHGLKAA